MRKLILILFICLAPTAYGKSLNDGVFYSQGGTLVPLQETQIQLKKELLKFFVRDFEFVDVEVDFEFYNPGKQKTVIVGFVTPPASGDVDENANHPRISRFTVDVNGKNLGFKIQKLSDTSFKGKETNGEDYVYYFDVTFKNGLNKIRHTYRFQGGATIDTQRDFDYQITTGKRWANKQIEDFELQIHLDRGIYYIPLSFYESGKAADWKIIGRGSFSGPKKGLYVNGKPTIRFVQIQDGYLSLKQSNFKPDKDISIGEFNWSMGWHNRMCKSDGACPKTKEVGDNLFQYFRAQPSEYVTDEMLAKLTKNELKIVRNYPYAIRGYPFKTKMLADFYKQFFWYKPDENLEITDVKLSAEEEAFIDKLKIVETQK